MTTAPSQSTAPAAPSAPAAPNLGAGNLLTDNPALYELAFPDPDHAAGRFVDGVVRRFGARGRRLLDLGCGTGRDAGYLAGLGYLPVGLDASSAMLGYARSRHPGVRFVEGRLQAIGDAVGPGARFDVITCLDSALLYCHDNADLAAALAGCHRHLAPGGLFVAEMRNGAHFLGNDTPLRAEQHRSLVADGVTYTARTRLWIDHAAQLLCRRRVWRRDGGPELAQESAWRLLFPAELAYFLAVAGFDVLACFDTPGPRCAGTGWRDDAVLGTSLRGDRLHVVARAVAR